MKSSVFGYAKPIDPGSIKPGTLLSVGLNDGERAVGVSYATDHDQGVVLFWSNQDGDIPRVEGIDGRYTFGLIDGVLEVEIEDIQDAFSPPTKARKKAGFAFTSNGKLAVVADVDYFGTPTPTAIDLDTGERLDPKGLTLTNLDFYRLFIRQEGRKDRWPLVEL